MMFWLFLAAVSVASLTFISVVVWSDRRLKERQEFYRFEFRKRLIDAGKLDAEAVVELMRYEHQIGLRQARHKVLTAGFIFVGTGIGFCVGLLFVGGVAWMLGFIPLSIGLCMLVYGFLIAAKPGTEPPPVGWAPEPGDRP